MEWSDVLNALASLLIVAALIGGLAFVARRSGLLGQFTVLKRSERRLSVEEVTLLDTRHRAVLLQCESRRYLLVLGTGTPPVILDKLDSIEHGTGQSS